MNMKMLYKLIILIPIFTYMSYFFIGVITTYILRLKNPLKKMDFSEQKIYLTFDDGVDSAYTPELLKLLKKHNIKASFFIVASSVKKNKELIQIMKNEGHIICLHSLKHHNQILQFPQQIKNDFEESIKIFNEQGIDISYYRPPWGHARLYGMYLCKKLKLNIVLWNIIIQDWEKDTTKEILCNKLKTKIHGNAVICLHDGRGKNNAPLKTIKTLETMIPQWQKEGYMFETVDKLF